MPMPSYRNTNYSPLYALLAMVLICIMSIAGPVFRPIITNLAGSVVLREFEAAFQDVQHPAGTDRLSVQAKMGEFAGGEQGCDFFVGEVRRYDSKKDVIFAFYADHANTSIPLKVVFIENGQIPAQESKSLSEPLNDLAGWELPSDGELQPLYLVYLLVVDNAGDLRLDCR